MDKKNSYDAKPEFHVKHVPIEPVVNSNMDNEQIIKEEMQNFLNEGLNEAEIIPQSLDNENFSEVGEVPQNLSEMASPSLTDEQSLISNDRMDPRQTLRNTGSSSKLQERLERSRGKNLFNNLLNRNRQNTDSDGDNKNSVQKTGEKIVEKGASAAAQKLGVPKSIADKASKELVGPMLEAMKKKYQKQIIIGVSCIAAVFLIILIPIIIIAGDSDYQAAESKNRSNYLYGSGSEEDLYEYLIDIGVCSDATECASTDAATFYKTLKSTLDNNDNLTQIQADSFIIKMISYKRQNKEAYKHSDEIEYIASIIGSNGSFHINNADNYKEEFIKDGGYFDTYRADLLNDNNSAEYKEKIYNEVVQNSKNLINHLESNADTGLIGGTCAYNVNGKVVSNIKVRLLTCDDYRTAEPIDNELIDFEKYITGVVYAELADGSKESFKTEAIAARNYVLLRGDGMGGNLGLKQENGEWVLSIRNCTKDQVYCDPDKGCWTNHKTAGDTVYSGTNENRAWGKGPLAENSELRKAVAETAGKVLVDSSGKLISTPYTNVQHTEWKRQANAGKDHFEILKATYPSATKIISTCTSSITGDFSLWKQYDPNWGSIPLGNSDETIKSAGCLVTSIAIQVAKSGTTITIPEFNPGTFVKQLNKNNGFTSSGGFYWETLLKVAPNFVKASEVFVTGSISERSAKIKSYADQGYYIVIRAKTNQHWVALDYVNGDTVYINDPGSKAVNLWEKYPLDYEAKRIGTRIVLYKNNG